MASATREEIQQEALSRAVNGQALTNWPAIFAGLMAKGIPENEIKPRENVLTYHAWRALGRQVRRGEHGIKVVTFVECEGKMDDTEEDDAMDKAKRRYRRPWTATVFHVSQTDPIVA
jgi:antirestriction protein ArdC